MEKTTAAAVYGRLDGGFDVRSCHAVWELSDKDESGIAANGMALFEDSRIAMSPV